MKNDSGLELSKWKKPKPGHSLEWVARRAKDTDQFKKNKIKIILNIWRQKNSQLSMAACRYNRLYYIPF